MDKIIIRGAREHNLKNINVEIPRNKLVVITGLSGSGKSSLAFDTIYAEGHRRYVESLSSYARQFLNIMTKPDVDFIEGLSPAIAIDQRSAAGSARSTVGTITEIYDYLRILYAHCGIPYCFRCGKKLVKQTPSEINNQILIFLKKTGRDKNLFILAPIIKEQKGEHRHLFVQFKKTGFTQARVDGILMDITEVPLLDKNKKHSIDLVIGEVKLKHSSEDLKKQLSIQVEKALKLGKGILILYDPIQKKDQVYSELYTCSKCGISLPEITPRLFSFNNPEGACPACTGLGVRLEIDPELVIPNPRLTLAEGAIFPWSRSTSKIGWYEKILAAVAKKYNFSVDVPVAELSEKVKKIIFYGTGDEIYEVEDNYGQIQKVKYEGVIADLERRHKETESEYVRREIEKYMKVRLCKVCKGNRLKPEVLAITLGGKSISDTAKMPIEKIKEFLGKLNIEKSKEKIAESLIKNILERLDLLSKIGLGYLTLDRTSTTLSGGEAQRVRLATQIGTKLMGVIYILDEPTIGLHSRDSFRLIEALKKLIEIGNSVLVVEHDRAVIKAADWIIDMGPGAGESGGQIVAVGTPKEISQNPQSLTGLYLAGKKSIAIPKKRRLKSSKKLIIVKAAENNLKNIDVEIPLGLFVCVTGVSGSGKSSLVDEILAKGLQVKYHRAKFDVGKHKEIKGTENLDKVIVVDQSPIGRTPRSNPATYTNVFALIREVFASTPEAKLRHYSLSHFSFNIQGGRCEFCGGDGVIKIEMHFLPDVYTTCPECKGKRYKSEILEIKYKDKNIADVLEMTVDTALEFFNEFPLIEAKLKMLSEVGLGYLKLGQPANTLSGGEAQRVKLAAELSRKPTGKTLYILDEPTTGLHFEDVKKLLNVLQKLVDKGNSVVITEHNLDVIKCVDWIIDLGPEGGDKGGWIVAQGTPEQVAKVKNSYTGQFLREVLK